MATADVVILAAGLGTRLGRPFPKPMTPLTTGETILGRQISCIRRSLGPVVRITIIVGFKMDLIVEAHPDVAFAYNQIFDSTNTAKSLLRGLEVTGNSGVLWLNGDVVFDEAAMDLIAKELAGDRSFICVNNASVGEEEVKYIVDPAGNVRLLSKAVKDAQGEAIGINYVAPHDKQALIARLRECSDLDYFEQGLEWLIERDKITVSALDISGFPCVEVDFDEDLELANFFLSGGAT